MYLLALWMISKFDWGCIIGWVEASLLGKDVSCQCCKEMILVNAHVTTVRVQDERNIGKFPWKGVFSAWKFSTIIFLNKMINIIFLN